MEDLQAAIEQLQAEGFWVIGPDLADEGDTIRLLADADYTVVARRPKPRRELVGQVRVTDYDPETGELMQERYVDLRDTDGRPT